MVDSKKNASDLTSNIIEDASSLHGPSGLANVITQIPIIVHPGKQL
jgi:hypothetical protein